jgi:single-strand DNA-binding protein
MVAIKARLQTWKYETSDEKKLTMIDIIAERITYLSSNHNKDQRMDEESSEK